MPAVKRKQGGPERIVAAAELLFSKTDYDAVSLASIAKKARTSQANVLYHFKSKRRLYLEVLRSIKSNLSIFMEAIGKQGKNNDATFLKTFAKLHLESLSSSESSARLLLREILGFGQLNQRDVAKDVLGRQIEAIREVIETEKSTGALATTVDSHVLLSAMFGANIIFFLTKNIRRHLVHAGGALDNKAFTDRLWRLLSSGVFAGHDKSAKPKSAHKRGNCQC